MAGVRSAIIGDISTVEQLPRAVGIYEASAWAGGLVGFTGAGFGLQIFGSFYLLSLAILSAIASVAIIILNKSVKYFKYE